MSKIYVPLCAPTSYLGNLIFHELYALNGYDTWSMTEAADWFVNNKFIGEPILCFFFHQYHNNRAKIPVWAVTLVQNVLQGYISLLFVKASGGQGQSMKANTLDLNYHAAISLWPTRDEEQWKKGVGTWQMRRMSRVERKLGTADVDDRRYMNGKAHLKKFTSFETGGQSVEAPCKSMEWSRCKRWW